MSNHRSTTNFVCRLAGSLGPRLVLLAGVIAAVLEIESRTELEKLPAPSVRPLAGPQGDAQAAPVWSLAFSPGGRHLASATIPGEVWLQDVSTGRSSLLQNGPQSSARSVAFSPDGQVVAASGSEAGDLVRMWNVKSGGEMRPLDVSPQSGIQHIAFPDGGAVLAVGGHLGGLSLWDWAERKRLAVLSGHPGNISALAFAPGGTRLASGDSDGVVNVWDVTERRLTTSLKARVSGLRTITALALSSGSLLATTCFLDPVVRLWDGKSGRARGTITVSDLGAFALAFSADGTMLAVADGDGSARLWDVAGNREIGAAKSPTGGLQSLALSGDGRLLATGATNGLVSLWDVTPANESEQPPLFLRTCRPSGATPGGSRLALIARK